jgi:hypothetical protein
MPRRRVPERRHTRPGARQSAERRCFVRMCVGNAETAPEATVGACTTPVYHLSASATALVRSPICSSMRGFLYSLPAHHHLRKSAQQAQNGRPSTPCRRPREPVRPINACCSRAPACDTLCPHNVRTRLQAHILTNAKHSMQWAPLQPSPRRATQTATHAQPCCPPVWPCLSLPPTSHAASDLLADRPPRALSLHAHSCSAWRLIPATSPPTARNARTHSLTQPLTEPPSLAARMQLTPAALRPTRPRSSPHKAPSTADSQSLHGSQVVVKEGGLRRVRHAHMGGEHTVTTHPGVPDGRGRRRNPLPPLPSSKARSLCANGAKEDRANPGPRLHAGLGGPVAVLGVEAPRVLLRGRLWGCGAERRPTGGGPWGKRRARGLAPHARGAGLGRADWPKAVWQGSAAEDADMRIAPCAAAAGQGGASRGGTARAAPRGSPAPVRGQPPCCAASRPEGGKGRAGSSAQRSAAGSEGRGGCARTRPHHLLLWCTPSPYPQAATPSSPFVCVAVGLKTAH